MIIQQNFKRHIKKTSITYLRFCISDGLTDYLVFLENDIVTFILERKWDGKRDDVKDVKMPVLPFYIEMALSEHLKTQLKYKQ